MNKFNYDKKYFNTYFERGRYLKNVRGDRSAMYGYWIKYLKRKFPLRSNLLEVGCGLGFFGKRLQESFTYIGLDISVDALNYATEYNHIKSVVHSEASPLPFESQSFDIIVAFDIVEHLEAPMNFFIEAQRILRSSGIMIISTPNTVSFGVKNKTRSKSLVPSMYKDPSHISLFTPKVWMDQIQNAGFVIERSGTDTLWDIPYFENIPLLFQKVVLVPFNFLVFMLFGFLNWTQGENLIIIARK